MSFHNGVPITVVGNIMMPTVAESSSRRRAEHDARVQADEASELHHKSGRTG